jgi:hypothetical protein
VKTTRILNEHHLAETEDQHVRLISQERSSLQPCWDRRLTGGQVQRPPGRLALRTTWGSCVVSPPAPADPPSLGPGSVGWRMDLCTITHCCGSRPYDSDPDPTLTLMPLQIRVLLYQVQKLRLRSIFVPSEVEFFTEFPEAVGVPHRRRLFVPKRWNCTLQV